MCAGDAIDVGGIGFLGGAASVAEDFCPEIGQGFSLAACLNVLRARCHRRALEESHGNRSEAARRLGVTVKEVHNFLRDNPGILSQHSFQAGFRYANPA